MEQKIRNILKMDSILQECVKSMVKFIISVQKDLWKPDGSNTITRNIILIPMEYVTVALRKSAENITISVTRVFWERKQLKLEIQFIIVQKREFWKPGKKERRFIIQMERKWIPPKRMSMRLCREQRMLSARSQNRVCQKVRNLKPVSDG